MVILLFCENHQSEKNTICWGSLYLEKMNIFHIYLCVLLLPPFDLPRSHSPPTNPTISAAAAASLIMSALTSWRYQQQFLFQSLRYTCTKGNSSRAHHQAKRSTKKKKIGIICTTLHDAFISGSLSNFVHIKNITLGNQSVSAKLQFYLGPPRSNQ